VRPALADLRQDASQLHLSSSRAQLRVNIRGRSCCQQIPPQRCITVRSGYCHVAVEKRHYILPMHACHPSSRSINSRRGAGRHRKQQVQNTCSSTVGFTRHFHHSSSCSTAKLWQRRTFLQPIQGALPAGAGRRVDSPTPTARSRTSGQSATGLVVVSGHRYPCASPPTPVIAIKSSVHAQQVVHP